jgi:hypothetical protein
MFALMISIDRPKLMNTILENATYALIG